MSPPPTDWHAVALAKLARVLGPERGGHEMRDALRDAGLAALGSADDLHAFAQVLIARGGFVGAVGGLLSLHAVMYGARGDDPASPGG